MRRLLAVPLVLISLAALAQSPSAGSPPPSVLVQTQAARQGSLPRMLTAYGSVQPSADGGSEALSFLRAGQVLRMTAVLGQQVHSGQALVTISADPAALATFRQATSALTLAQGERDRMAQMLAQHLATRDQLAQADKAVADAQSTLQSLNRAGGGSAEQTLDAPFDGVVSAVMVSPGTRVAAGAPLVTLARSGRFVVSVGVEPGQRSLLAPGQPTQVEPLDGGPPVSGSVLSVGGMLDPVSRLLPVLVTLAPGDGQTEAAANLLSGSPVRAVVQVGEMRGWLVPRNAVMTDAKGAYLFQVNGATAARVDVRVVGMAGDTTVVDGTLDGSRALVTSGNAQLQDGGLVRMAQAVADSGAAKP